MTFINVTNFALISWLEKDDSMIETRCLKNVFIFFQTSKWFCYAFKLGFLQLMSKASLILKSNSEFINFS